MRNAERYHLVKCGKKHLLVSTTSKLILETLAQGGHFSYRELHDETSIPIDSMYVFCQRLERAKLIKRIRKQTDKTRQLRTTIKAAKAVEFIDLTVIH